MRIDFTAESRFRNASRRFCSDTFIQFRKTLARVMTEVNCVSLGGTFSPCRSNRWGDLCTVLAPTIGESLLSASLMSATPKRNGEKNGSSQFLGIECGGTRSVALWADATMRSLLRFQVRGANLRLTTDRELLKLFKEVKSMGPQPAGVGVGMAGARTDEDRLRVNHILAKVWPGVPVESTHDMETALRAASKPGTTLTTVRIVVLSGTGSCCYGRDRFGKIARVGGWGHFLGDRGSGYDLAMRALRRSILTLDHHGNLGELGLLLVKGTGVGGAEELISWVQGASKAAIAALAPRVFDALRLRDQDAKDVISQSASALAADAVSCARKLVLEKDSRLSRLEFILAGSVLLKEPLYSHAVKALVQETFPGSIVKALSREPVWGGVDLACQAWRDSDGARHTLNPRQRSHQKLSSQTTSPPARTSRRAISSSKRSEELPPTELRNPRSKNLDRLSVESAVELMLSEEGSVAEAVRGEHQKICRAIRMLVAAFRKDGRLFYVGAGTSGRLGVLDASECPPTFRTPPEMIQAVMAGGNQAMFSAVEGAEDDADAGADSLKIRGCTKKDVVVGIAASGRTPFVWGALKEAQSLGAKTILICFNPGLIVDRKFQPDVIIAPATGAEVLTGSTRLKAGTATKLILNMLTTLSMVRLGKVVENLMIDLNPSNLKLKDRAVRIVCELCCVDESRARETLEARGWNVKEAVRGLRRAQRNP